MPVFLCRLLACYDHRACEARLRSWRPCRDGHPGRLAGTAAAAGRPRGLGELKSGRYLIVTPDGRYRGSPGVEEDLVYVVLTRDGRQEMLRPADFSKRFGWKNDPSRVRQMGQ
jgi:hypothetical protein